MKVLLFEKMLNLNDRIVDAYIGMCGCNPFKVSYECLSMPDSELNDKERHFKKSLESGIKAAISHNYENCYSEDDVKKLLQHLTTIEISSIVNSVLNNEFEDIVGPLNECYKKSF